MRSECTFSPSTLRWISTFGRRSATTDGGLGCVRAITAPHRLRGDVCDPDYDFLDPRINALYEDLNDLVYVAGWIHGHRALSPKINWAWNELAVLDRLFPDLRGRARYEQSLRAITRASNDLLFRLVLDLAAAHEAGRSHRWNEERLAAPCDRLLERLAVARDGFVARNQTVLLRTIANQRLAVAA